MNDLIYDAGCRVERIVGPCVCVYCGLYNKIKSVDVIIEYNPILLYKEKVSKGPKVEMNLQKWLKM